jgi:CubicO group peptidase (beta-lactamase class C family)
MARPFAILLLAVTTAFQAAAQTSVPEVSGPRQRKAITKAAIDLDVLRDGKKIGSTKIPAGRQVSVIEEQGARMRVAAGPLVSGWVSSDDLQVEHKAEVPPALKENSSLGRTDRLARAPASLPSFPPVDVSKELNLIRVLHNMPGLSALAVKSGRIVAQGAAGYRRLGDPEPLLVTDPINIGSCTKWMTATVAGRLVDRGVIKWNTRVRDCFKNYKNFHPAFHDATLEQILAHRAGLLDSEAFAKQHAVGTMQGASSTEARRLWVCEAVLRAAPEVPLGEFNYSNEGYVVAGTMMQIATRKDWETLVREEIFAPARMTTGTFGPVFDDKIPAKAPVGHDLESAHDIPVPRVSGDADFKSRVAAYGPGGGAACSLQDWAKFLHIMATLDRSTYLAPETVLKLSGRYTAGEDYGLGVKVYNFPWSSPGAALCHAGSIWGLDSLFWVAPAHDLVIVAFANCYARDGTLGEGRASGEALNKVADLLIKRFGQKPPAGPALEFPLVLSLAESRRHPATVPELSLKEMQPVW